MAGDPEMDDLLMEFLVESNENLDRLDRELLELEKNPQAANALAGIFRTIHTIKGTCGFLGFGRLEGVTHVGESLLSRLRDHELVLNPAIMTALLGMVDAVRAMLAGIENTGSEGTEDYSTLIEELRALQASAPNDRVDHDTMADAMAEMTAEASQEVVAPAPPPAPKPAAPSAAPAPTKAPAAAKPAPAPAKGSPGPSPSKASPPPPAPTEPAAPVAAVATRPPSAPPAPVAHPAEHASAENAHRGPSVADAYVRVDVGLLDRLMNLVGELVLARNQILQFVPLIEDQAFNATSQRLNIITTDLQSGVMKTRMQPIGNLWEKLPRIVRDLSLSLGKQIEIEMEGRETELDKTIIEAIKDPLTHIVRNCVDHGIETPDQRTAAGKSPEGRLRLRAFHEGGQVNIEISDDGAGLNLERIRNKAIERGLISTEQASRMLDHDIYDLVFAPGFSTAEKVSNISGRGVGMDVVKTNVERIGGFVDLQSRPGNGTTFRIKIPLTLAIIPALVISSENDRYAIPQISLVELVRLEGAQVKAGIDQVHGAPVYRLRGTLLPLVTLNKELRLGESSYAHDLTKAETVSIVVLQADKCRFGLVVDEINDTEEIVVKPLGKHLKGISAFAGATIMGDGRVSLILDVLGLAQQANVLGEHADRSRNKRFGGSDAQTRNKTTLLLCALADRRPMAVPLSMVARLEVMESEDIESLADYNVVQYRGEVMPLVDLESLGNGGMHFSKPESGPVHVVVYGQGDHHVGLAVGEILDIVEENLDLKQHRTDMRPGVLGCAVIQGRVTEIVDLDALLKISSTHFITEGGTDVGMASPRVEA